METLAFEGTLAGYEIMKLVPAGRRVLKARFNKKYTIVLTVAEK